MKRLVTLGKAILITLAGCKNEHMIKHNDAIKHCMVAYFGGAAFFLAFVLISIIALYTFFRHIKFILEDVTSKAKFNFWVIFFILSIIVLVFSIFGCTFILVNYLFKGFIFSADGNRQAAATLTTGSVATLSLLGTLFGILYTSYQNRVQSIHEESSWRKTALELEQKNFYTIKDLIKLNSLFNAYKQKRKDDIFPVDFYINQVIIKILDNHKINLLEMTEFLEMRENIIDSLPKKKRKREKITIPFLYKNSVTDEFTKTVNLQKKDSTLFNYDINSTNMYIALNSEENQVVRKCIHALLKNDWDNITK